MWFKNIFCILYLKCSLSCTLIFDFRTYRRHDETPTGHKGHLWPEDKNMMTSPVLTPKYIHFEIGTNGTLCCCRHHCVSDYRAARISSRACCGRHLTTVLGYLAHLYSNFLAILEWPVTGHRQPTFSSRIESIRPSKRSPSHNVMKFTRRLMSDSSSFPRDEGC